MASRIKYPPPSPVVMCTKHPGVPAMRGKKRCQSCLFYEALAVQPHPFKGAP